MITSRFWLTRYIFCTGYHKVRDHCLVTMSIDDNYLGGSAIPETSNNCSEIAHKVLACLDIKRSIFFTGLRKFVHPAYAFKVCFHEDLYLRIEVGK